MSYAKLKGWFGKAKTARFTATADTADGAVVIENGRVGVALNNTAQGEQGLMIVETDEKGIAMPKTAALEIKRNDSVYVNESTKLVTKTATDIYVGKAVEDAAAADDEVVVELTNASVVLDSGT